MIETRVRLTARMYEVRDTVRRISKDYRKNIAKVRPYINAAMLTWDFNEIQAAQWMMVDMQKRAPGSETAQMLVLATAVEMIESDTEPKP